MSPLCPSGRRCRLPACPASPPRSPTTSPAPRSTSCPPGQWGGAPVPPGADSQAKLYDSLTPRFDQVTADDLTRSFKSERFGVGPDGPATAESVPRKRRADPARPLQRAAHQRQHARRHHVGDGLGARRRTAGCCSPRAATRRASPRSTRPTSTPSASSPGSRPTRRRRAVDRMILRNGLRALRSQGEDGKRLLHDVDVFVAGVNARLRAEKSTAKRVHPRRPVRGQRARRPDLRRGRRRRGRPLAVPRRAAQAARQRRRRRRLFDDLSRAPRRRHAGHDRQARSTTPRCRARPSGSVILDAGSLQAGQDRRRVAPRRRRTTPRWASNFLIVGKQRSTTGPPAVRRPARRSATSTPASRSRPTSAGPAGRRAASTRRRNPGQHPDRPRAGLRVEPHLGRLRPRRRVRRGALRRLEDEVRATRASAARWARSTPARSRARAASSTARPSTAR